MQCQERRGERRERIVRGSSSSVNGKFLNKRSANSVFSNKHFNVDVGNGDGFGNI